MNRSILPLAAAAFALAFFAISPSATSAQESAKVVPTINWVTIGVGLEEAAKTNKKLLIDFYTDWCGWCKRMDRDTYADSSVVAYVNENYVAVKLNPEKEGKFTFQGEEYSLKDFAAAMQVSGYPATGFINEKSEVVTLVPGYQKAGEFINVMRYIAEDAYLTMTFPEFIDGKPAKKEATAAE